VRIVLLCLQTPCCLASPRQSNNHDDLKTFSDKWQAQSGWLFMLASDRIVWMWLQTHYKLYSDGLRVKNILVTTFYGMD
jgi:hypothetical protein